MPVVVSGTAMVLAASMACLKASTEITSSFTVPAGTATPNGTRKVHVRSGGDPVRCDQLTKAFPGEDHCIGRDAAGELRGNCLWPCSLRRPRSGRDLDAAGSLEFRQKLLVRTTESA